MRKFGRIVTQKSRKLFLVNQEKPLKPLPVLVGREGIEPSTN